MDFLTVILSFIAAIMILLFVLLLTPIFLVFCEDLYNYAVRIFKGGKEL